MKRCPQCNRDEVDNTLAFCRSDGVALIDDSRSIGGDTDTTKFGSSQMSTETTAHQWLAQLYARIKRFDEAQTPADGTLTRATCV